MKVKLHRNVQNTTYYIIQKTKLHVILYRHVILAGGRDLSSN